MLPRCMTLTAADTGCVAASAECWRSVHPQTAMARNTAGTAPRRENQAANVDVCTVDLYVLAIQASRPLLRTRDHTVIGSSMLSMRGDEQIDRLIPASLLKETITRSLVVRNDEGWCARSGSEEWRRTAERRAAASDREGKAWRLVRSRMAHAKHVSTLRHQDDGGYQRGEVELRAIQIDMLRRIGRAFALGKQLC